MGNNQTKEMLELLKKSAQSYLNPSLKSYENNDNAQEIKNATTEFLLSWLTDNTHQHPLLDDYISSIQNKPEQFIAVLEAIGVLMALKIIKI
jgi:hypothetical protein